MAASITGYAAYVPAYRLGRDSGVRGRRVVASFDENSTTMAVAAARGLASDALKPDTDVWFATTSPAYLDKTNATAIHAALGLAPSALATDAAGSSRSTVGALRAVARHDDRDRVAPVRRADGAGFVELVVRDLQKTFVESIRCTWRGDQAMQFWTAFGAHLRPGRPLHLGVQHIKATHDGQMTARVTSCSLAPLPPSHLKHIQHINQPNHHQGATA